MTKTNITTRTYDYDGTYMVEIVTTEEYYEAWLYNVDYGYKMLMFGCSRAKQSYKKFINDVEYQVRDYIGYYIEEVEDKEFDNCAVADEDIDNPVVVNIQSAIVELFDRTYNNCLWYQGRNEEYSLANETGVLRGIAYCMEVVGLCPHTDEFLHMIDVQQELKSRDNKGE